MLFRSNDKVHIVKSALLWKIKEIDPTQKETALSWKIACKLQYLLMELWSNLAEAEAEAFSFFRKGALSLPSETLRVARI